MYGSSSYCSTQTKMKGILKQKFLVIKHVKQNGRKKKDLNAWCRFEQKKKHILLFQIIKIFFNQVLCVQFATLMNIENALKN